MKKGNHIAYPFLLTLLVIIGLACLQLLPDDLTLCGYLLRKVNLFSDIIPHAEETDSMVLASDTVSVGISKKIAYTPPEGVTMIEDFSLLSDSTEGSHGMDRFFQALMDAKSQKQTVRIAYFGDSFIEGDLMTSDLRAMLQSAYGGCGVGYVDINSPVSGFRGSIRTSASHWSSHSVTDSAGFHRIHQGIAERYFYPLGNATVHLNGLAGKKSLHQDTCQISTLFFKASEPITITARINREESTYFYPEASDKVQQITVSGRIGQMQWSVKDSLAGTFFGATMDGESGVILDNFSMRGSSGASLRNIPDETLCDFAELRPYDLIVFHFGLNVANDKVKDYSHYQKQMEEVIAKFAQCYPQAGILIVGMSDRGERDEGEVKTMPCVKNLNRYQKQLAMQTRSCYWNLFEAMGGEGSMARMADIDKPAQANKDYTHINARGGKFVAEQLFNAIQAGIEYYEKRRNQK